MPENPQDRALVAKTGDALAPLVRSDRNPALVYLARLGAGSRRVQLGALNAIAALVRPGATIATLPWADLEYQHTGAIRAKLAELYAPATANRFLAALRGTLKEAWRLGLIARETYERAADLEVVVGVTLPAGRQVTGDELTRLFDHAFDATGLGARDGALLAILYGGGLRRSEVVALELADLSEDGTLTIRHGKGNKARTVPLPQGAMAVVEGWLSLRGDAPGPLLCHVLRGGAPTMRRLTGQGVKAALESMAARAGVAEFTPHDLRRTFISNLLDAGVDIATVQRLAGHSKVDTTSRYDRRGEETKRRATANLRFP